VRSSPSSPCTPRSGSRGSCVPGVALRPDPARGARAVGREGKTQKGRSRMAL